MHRLVIFGTTGRMGQSLLRALADAPGLRLAAAVASAASASLGKDAVLQGAPCGIPVTADVEAALREAAVAVDFSLPQAVAAHAAACAAAAVPLLVGSTGLDDAANEALRAAAGRIPVLVAANTSVGVNAMERLVANAARTLGAGFDAEIIEAHHRMKRDAPSGTAIALGEAIAAARGGTLADLAVFDRHGDIGARRPESIGFSVVRGGDIVGEHTVIFAADGERIEITHRATDRMIFARGALRAASWLIGRPAGLYRMQDIFGG